MTRAQRLIRLAIAGLILLSSLAGCASGSGTIVSEARDVGDFNGVDVSGGIHVVITVDPESTRSQVTSIYDDNLQGKVRTEVVDGTLMVEANANIDVTETDRHVEVAVASLETLLVSGGAHVDGAGSASVLAVEVDGGAEVDLASLVVQNMDVSASAGAKVDVRVETAISGDVSSGAELTVLGDPPNRTLDVSGGGEVH
jgi:preprotein translocase subunit SecD